MDNITVFNKIYKKQFSWYYKIAGVFVPRVKRALG